MTVSGVWVAVCLAVAIVADVSLPARVALATIGAVPPLALLLWWNEPSQTMSESIQQARR